MLLENARRGGRRRRVGGRREAPHPSAHVAALRHLEGDGQIRPLGLGPVVGAIAVLVACAETGAAAVAFPQLAPHGPATRIRLGGGERNQRLVRQRGNVAVRPPQPRRLLTGLHDVYGALNLVTPATPLCRELARAEDLVAGNREDLPQARLVLLENDRSGVIQRREDRRVRPQPFALLAGFRHLQGESQIRLRGEISVDGAVAALGVPRPHDLDGVPDDRSRRVGDDPGQPRVLRNGNGRCTGYQGYGRQQPFRHVSRLLNPLTPTAQTLPKVAAEDLVAGHQDDFPDRQHVLLHHARQRGRARRLRRRARRRPQPTLAVPRHLDDPAQMLSFRFEPVLRAVVKLV